MSILYIYIYFEDMRMKIVRKNRQRKREIFCNYNSLVIKMLWLFIRRTPFVRYANALCE